MPRNGWEGLAAVARAISGRMGLNAVANEEAAGRASANASMASLFGQGAFPPAPSMEGDSVVPAAGGADAYRNAIASIESAGSGDYSAVGPTHPKLGRALGKYQVMEANVGPWSQEALGQALTGDQFLANPKAQDAVFDHRFGSYVQKYGNPQDAASAWFTGRPQSQGGNARDVLGTTGNAYVEKFNRALGGTDRIAAALASQPAAIPAPQSPGVQRVAQAMGGGQPVESDWPGHVPVQPGNGNPTLQQLMQAAQNPWLSEQQQGVLNLMLKQQMDAADPLRQLQLQKGQLELDALRNPADWSRLDDGRLYNKRTGEVRDAPTAPGASPTDLGLNPQYGVDANGNPVLLQLGKNGRAVQTAMPDGVSLSKEPIKLDAGTHFVLLDPITRQPVGTVQKDIVGEEAAKVAGKAQGEASVDLEPSLQKANDTLSLIEQLRNHPGRTAATGKDYLRGSIPGTQAFDFAKINDQAQGRAFLEAFTSLKGGGQITEVEGKKATDAIARLDRAQTEEGYLAALDDLETIVLAGMERSRRKAGKSTGVSGPSQPAAQDDGWTTLPNGVKIRKK
jgi:hypothetical protein